MKKLLLVAHTPSANTKAMCDAVVRGAGHGDIDGVDVFAASPFDVAAEQVLEAQAVILGTTENLGYMSGALKDFFDRIYYPCLEKTQGLPFAIYVRAGHDGTGTVRGIETITTGLRWRSVREPLVCKGEYSAEFEPQCEELGMLMAAGLESGVF